MKVAPVTDMTENAVTLVSFSTLTLSYNIQCFICCSNHCILSAAGCDSEDSAQTRLDRGWSVSGSVPLLRDCDYDELIQRSSRRTRAALRLPVGLCHQKDIVVGLLQPVIDRILFHLVIIVFCDLSKQVVIKMFLDHLTFPHFSSLNMPLLCVNCNFQVETNYGVSHMV